MTSTGISSTTLSRDKQHDGPKLSLEPPPAYQDAPPVSRPRGPAPLNLPALNLIRGKRVILASSSPRRKQLLAQIGLVDLEIIPSTAPEDRDKSLGPLAYVLDTAVQKAQNVYRAEIDSPKGEPAIVIAADTVIATHFGQILEKPRSERHHIEMLKALRDENNGWHKVYTAVVCMAPLDSLADPGYAMEHSVEETAVKFDQSITDELIVSYVKTREGADKAGGYGIQGTGSILVETINGTFDNVVGLPLRTTLRLIEGVIVNPAKQEEVEDEDVI
ncbi:hypothetical protein AMS68_002515 [Peltaster fructicola]|uniref:Maf-like protein n=1 Tax=Peltaster fructicola TaxID=286661 RepID=A0A6H0XQS9_9PEZI|nr:hypothetical protein AMS68_002515 [Peltaster fructicola]